MTHASYLKHLRKREIKHKMDILMQFLLQVLVETTGLETNRQ
jgi:hypothetical protein